MNIFLKKNKNKKIVILDIPLLLENKIYNKKKDILIFIDSPKKEIIKRLKKNGCDLLWTEDITLSLQKDKGKLLGKMMGDGYITLTCPQIGIRLLYVKVYGGKGMLWGKKILYSVYQQDYDEKKWTPLGTFKSWGLAVTGINNIFRSEGLLQGSAL